MRDGALSYSPFGVPDASVDGFAFTGEMRDANGLQYHRARYYSPELGVWPSLDPLELGNRYVYVNGNPATLVDPSGLVFENPYVYDVCGQAQQIENPCFDPFYRLEHPSDCRDGEFLVPFNYADCFNIPILSANSARRYCSNEGRRVADYLKQRQEGWSVELFGYETSASTAFHAFIMLTDWRTGTEYGYSAGPMIPAAGKGLVLQTLDRIDMFGIFQALGLADKDAFGIIIARCSTEPYCHTFDDRQRYVDEGGGPRLVIAAGDGNAEYIKRCFDNETMRIVVMGERYVAQGPNSNTFVNTLLTNCDLPVVEPDGSYALLDSVNFPGWLNQDLD